jgi:hypothetical protein
MAETLLTNRSGLGRVALAEAALENIGLADSVLVERDLAGVAEAELEDASAGDSLKAEQAREALQNSSIYTLRTLFVEQDGDCVVLRGRVESFYHKQLAQELVRAAIDGAEVVNRISVVYGRERNLAGAD